MSDESEALGQAQRHLGEAADAIRRAVHHPIRLDHRGVMHTMRLQATRNAARSLREASEWIGTLAKLRTDVRWLKIMAILDQVAIVLNHANAPDEALLTIAAQVDGVRERVGYLATKPGAPILRAIPELNG